VKFGRPEIGKVVRYLPDKNVRLVIQLSLIVPEICQGQSPRMYSECSRFTFGGVIPERVNTIKTGRKVFPVFG